MICFRSRQQATALYSKRRAVQKFSESSPVSYF